MNTDIHFSNLTLKKKDSFHQYSRPYYSASFLSRSRWKGRTLENFDNIREKRSLSLSVEEGIFRNSRQSGKKRSPRKVLKKSEKKREQFSIACPARKFESSRARRNGCQVAKLVPRITSYKSRGHPDGWLRNFRVLYTHPSSPLLNFIRVSNEISGSQSILTLVFSRKLRRFFFIYEYEDRTIFNNHLWFSFEVRLEKW